MDKLDDYEDNALEKWVELNDPVDLLLGYTRRTCGD